MSSKNPQQAKASMNLSLIPIDLRAIAEKVDNRQRISEAEALQLYRSHDLNALGIMASAVRTVLERASRASQRVEALADRLSATEPRQGQTRVS